MKYAEMDRASLGFTRACGHLSLGQNAMAVGGVDWDDISRTWGRNATEGLSFVPAPIDLNSNLFICRGRLAQHTDVVGDDTASIGLIADCASDFQLATHGKRINAMPGDVFILDPHHRHGAETKSDFAFLVIDVPICVVRTFAHYVRLFKQDLRNIAAHQRKRAA